MGKQRKGGKSGGSCVSTWHIDMLAWLCPAPHHCCLSCLPIKLFPGYRGEGLSGEGSLCSTHMCVLVGTLSPAIAVGPWFKRDRASVVPMTGDSGGCVWVCGHYQGSSQTSGKWVKWPGSKCVWLCLCECEHRRNWLSEGWWDPGQLLERLQGLRDCVPQFASICTRTYAFVREVNEKSKDLGSATGQTVCLRPATGGIHSVCVCKGGLYQHLE